MSVDATTQPSKEEIQQFIDAARTLASKAVLTALIHVVNDRPIPVNEDLAQEIRELMPCNYSGYASITIEEIKWTLNISLTIAERDYRVETLLPSENYAKDLYDQYDFLRRIACAYWHQFREEHPALIAKIESHRPDVDFTSLHIDPANNTTLYFDPLCTKRISLFTYYLDDQGRPFHKK